MSYIRFLFGTWILFPAAALAATALNSEHSQSLAEYNNILSE